MVSSRIDPAMTIDEIMRRWPSTIRVLIRSHMLCIGCPIGVFHTVSDACAAHELDQNTFSQRLLAAIQSDEIEIEPSAFSSQQGVRPANAQAETRGV